MSVTSNRTIQIAFTGDVEYSQDFSAATNATASGQIQNVSLTTGANTITVPANAIGATIIPPSSNTVALTLKGVSGDTGIALALTSPCSISLASVGTFVLNAASAVTVRIIYT